MKTRYLIAAASALLLAAGCAREMDFNTPGSSVLRAVIEQETRVSFDATGKFAWDEGDKIAVYVGNAFEEVEVEAATGAFRIVSAGDRSFYAVYPASVAPATNASLTVTLPATYDISSVTDADYSPVPMVAENLQGQDELYFLHVGGLVRIICKDLPDAVTTAVVSFDKDVTGTYTVNTANPSNPTITTAGNATNNTVTFTVGGKKDFVLNVPVPCGTYTNVSLALDGATAKKLNETDLTFARHHGKTLMIGELEFTYKLDGLHDVIAEYVGGTKELSQAFASYKTDGIDKVGVPFTFEFSQTGEDGTWSETGAPDWLRVADGVDYTGSTAGEPLHLVITAQENTAVDHHGNELKSRVGRHPANFDLSTYNVATGATVAKTTANCYVVDAPGTYRFPVVYGNALKDGAPNEDAWHAREGEGGEYRTENWTDERYTFNETAEPFSNAYGLLAYMVDHRDNPITSPYIATQLTNDGYTNISYTADFVWTDVNPNTYGRLIDNVRLDGEGENMYIAFEVPAENIQQGNAVIALKATYTVTNGETTETITDVVWSWHIWVTDADLTAIEGPNGYSFAPQNIGWRDTREIARYNERTWYVRVKQTEDNGITSDPLLVISNAGDITIESGGRSMVYVGGRKDPRPGSYIETKGTNAPIARSNSQYMITSAGYATTVVNDPVYVAYKQAMDAAGQPEDVTWAGPLTVGMFLRYPRATNSSGRVNQWTNCVWHNLWNTSSNIQNTYNYTEVFSTKTIYDPCPTGYKVPTWPSLAGFNTANMVYTTVDGVTGRMYGDNLFFPFIPSTSQSTEFARYSTANFDAGASRTLFDFYTDYVYGRTNEAFAGTYVIRPGKE